MYQAVNDTYLEAFSLKREDFIGKYQKELLCEAWIDFPGKGNRYVHVDYHTYTPKRASGSGK